MFKIPGLKGSRWWTPRESHYSRIHTVRGRRVEYDVSPPNSFIIFSVQSINTNCQTPTVYQIFTTAPTTTTVTTFRQPSILYNPIISSHGIPLMLSYSDKLLEHEISDIHYSKSSLTHSQGNYNEWKM